MENFMKSLIIVFGVIALSFSRQVRSESQGQRYKVGHHVPFYVNKIGPFQNPRETYSYYDFPFCKPDQDFKEKKQTLGEALNGDRLVAAPYKLEFRVNKDIEIACHKNLTKQEVSQFRTMLERGFIYQMYFDELPVWSFIGEFNSETTDSKHEKKYLLYEQIHIEVSYNGDRVIEIKFLTYPEAFKDITQDKETTVEFLYTVYWKQTNKPFEKRMEKYDSSSSQSNAIKYQQLSTVNSSITLLLLVGSLAKVYIRNFKKDLADEELVSNQEATRGWKSIRDDVFAQPDHKSLLVSVFASGVQLLTLTVVLLILGLSGMFYPHNRGILLSTSVMTLAVTSVVSGFTSTFFYSHFEGTNWLRNLLLTISLFSGPLLFTFLILNSLATYHKASTALSMITASKLVLIWAIIAFPLLLLGGAFGKRKNTAENNDKQDLRARLNVAKIGREVQKFPWYCRTFPQMVFAGFFSFACLYSQLPIMIHCIWDHGVFGDYSTLSVQFFLSVLEMAMISIVLTAKQLGREDPKWWWRSFLHGGSVGLYVYGYCISYYLTRSSWSGPLQLSFFFGYMACVCYGISLVFGAASFMASFLFVRIVYRSIKSD